MRSISEFPRVRLAHTPTPLEAMPRLTDAIGGPELWIKRDDCTGLVLGGNKARQLEFHFGEALEAGATTVIITGAVQSNYARTAAAAAARLGMGCEIQLEERVPGVDETYRTSGNVLLSQLLGARLHSYPEGEDEAGADAALQEIAERVRREGGTPYVVPLAPGHPPIGALAYVEAATEILDQAAAAGIEFDRVIVPTGTAMTHAGLLVGLRLAGCRVAVDGMCVRRSAAAQAERVAGVVGMIESLLECPGTVERAEVCTDDRCLGPGYGLPTDATLEAVRLAARHEALILDPVYTGKALAGLIARAREGALDGERVLFVHTGGTPALFAYGPRFGETAGVGVEGGATTARSAGDQQPAPDQQVGEDEDPKSCV